MIIEFPYQLEESKLFGAVLRPVAVVKLKQRDRVVPVEMYVDSGADVTVIPRRLGEFLGFVIEQGEISEICGIGDAVVPIIIKNVSINIGEREFSARIAWAMINDVPPLLGRLDVFDRFDIEFKQNEKRVLFNHPRGLHLRLRDFAAIEPSGSTVATCPREGENRRGRGNPGGYSPGLPTGIAQHH